MKQWAGRAAWLAGVAALSLTTGCGTFFVYPGSTGSGGSSSGNYVYVANATTETLAGFSVGTGTLTAVTNSPYSLGFAPTAVAINPANSILFVGGSGAIYAFSIGTGGQLSLLNNGFAVGLANVASMDISPDGKWLFALDQNGITLDEFQINSTTGVLTQLTGASYAVSGATIVPKAVKIAPSGAYVFAALGTAGDLVFPFNTSTGAISNPLTLSLPSGNSDNALAVSPSSSYLYIARSGTGGGVGVYTIGSGGTLTAVTGSPFSAGSRPFSVVVNNAGTDVYVGNQLDNSISGYSVASSGTLTALTGSPYANGSAVIALAADRTGTYLLAAASSGTPDLTMYSFDSATVGKLDLATSTSTGTDPTGPVALAMTH
ncbi:MAG TPA: beta-propeller fold lactonase family protein [Acidobacteriaceae bacterium]